MDEFLIANQKKDINSPLNSVSSFNNISSYNGLLCDNDTTYERLKFIGRTSIPIVNYYFFFYSWISFFGFAFYFYFY